MPAPRTTMHRSRPAARPRVLAALAACALAAGAACADVVDNCATFLGSLSRELRYAHALPPGTRSTFQCPRERETRTAIGASRQRVLNALGTPDESGHAEDGAMLWTYVFASSLGGPPERTGGAPVLSLRFDGEDQIEAIDCAYAR